MKEKQGFLSMIKLGLILAVFAAAACVMLAFVYSGTKKIIDERQQADTRDALRELFPDADSFEEVAGIVSPDSSVTIEKAYSAARNGEITGAALELARGGYGGPIKILAGVSAGGVITGVKIMSHTETPGLGANAASPSYFVDKARGLTFLGQFDDKSINDSFEVKGDVAAITASTVTSNAIAAAVKAAGKAVSAWLAGEEVDVVSGASTGDTK